MILFWVSDENSGDSTLSLVFAELCLQKTFQPFVPPCQ